MLYYEPILKMVKQKKFDEAWEASKYFYLVSIYEIYKDSFTDQIKDELINLFFDSFPRLFKYKDRPLGKQLSSEMWSLKDKKEFIYPSEVDALISLSSWNNFYLFYLGLLKKHTYDQVYNILKPIWD